MGTTLNITIGTYTFKATLLENETTKAFKAMLPLTLLMSELNGNEKYFHFSSDLPTHPSKLGTIHAGDVMLWGSNSFVLFYQTFSTSYAYTRLGHIEDTTYLQQALGKGNVMVSLALE
ncbi:cyclophilin-like fold protein [Sulfurospirillum arsenophilum]|uniref:cyclophilin-like fold protein n=1 Tax=Sulfurospirillum arsenophilum TaxID=56698 RepID=UPI0006937222|nr:cyclophilin-like fold protein [Sulfurospirillum arsenophilum]